MRQTTISDAMRRAGGSASGFDYLRLGLALYVLAAHCCTSTDAEGAPWLWQGGFGPCNRSVLPMFFALSGFLVSGSFARNDVVSFVALRGLRIAPALAVEVVLSALALGPILTVLPLGDYLRSPVFLCYWLNIVGDVHFVLPGVLGGRPVNGQLWTIPFELQCYLCLVALSLVAKANRSRMLLALLAGASAAITYTAVARGLGRIGPTAPHLVLTFSFLSGVCLNMYADRIPLRLDLFAASAACAYVCLYVPQYAFLAPPAIAYLTVYLGLLRPPRLSFGDLSYGVYLYHAPILAAVYAAFGARASAWRLFAVGLPLTLLFAWLSWRLVESPLLARKRAMLVWVHRQRALWAHSEAAPGGVERGVAAP